MPGGMQPPEAESEVLGLIGRSLDLLRNRAPERRRAIRHLEEALKAMREQPQGIHPEELSSANDG